MLISKPHVILGIGNLLMSDDGIGIHAIAQLMKMDSLTADVADVGTSSIDAVQYLENAQRTLIIDAVKGNGTPGSIYLQDIQSMRRAPPGSSMHSLSVLEMWQLLHPAQQLPKALILGVEPRLLEYGSELSPTLQAVLPQVVAIAKRITDHWAEGKVLAGGTRHE